MTPAQFAQELAEMHAKRTNGDYLKSYIIELSPNVNEIIRVEWTQSKSAIGNRWTGYASIARTVGDQQVDYCRGHIIEASDSTPIGDIRVWLDPFAAGCAAALRVSGLSIKEDHLTWITAWAYEAIRHFHLLQESNRQQCPCNHFR